MLQKNRLYLSLFVMILFSIVTLEVYLGRILVLAYVKCTIVFVARFNCHFNYRDATFNTFKRRELWVVQFIVHML